MPEEGGSGRRVVSDAVEEVGCVLVHCVVDYYCFILPSFSKKVLFIWF